jgi:hypothetical protein
MNQQNKKKKLKISYGKFSEINQIPLKRSQTQPSLFLLCEKSMLVVKLKHSLFIRKSRMCITSSHRSTHQFIIFHFNFYVLEYHYKWHIIYIMWI